MVQINKYVWYSSANFTWTGSWWSSSPSPSSLQWTAWPRWGMDSEWNGLTRLRWKHDASPVETLTSSAEGKPPRKESPPFWSRVMSDRSHQRKWNIKWCQIEEIEEDETPAKINAPMKVSRLNCWYVCLQSEQADVSTTHSVQELVKVVKVRFQDGSFPQFLAPIFYLSPLQVDWMNTTQLNTIRHFVFFFLSRYVQVHNDVPAVSAADKQTYAQCRTYSSEKPESHLSISCLGKSCRPDTFVRIPSCFQNPQCSRPESKIGKLKTRMKLKRF